MNQQLNQLLLDAIATPSFCLTQKQLNEDLGAISAILLAEKILVPTQAKLYVPCDNCGQTHRIVISNNKCYFNCENDENAALQEVAEADLLGYKLSIANFAAWLSEQIKTKDVVASIDSDRAWYLGSIEAGGAPHRCYFSLLTSFNEVQYQQQRLSTSNAIMLWLDHNSHTAAHRPNGFINLIDLLDLNGNNLVFNNRLFRSYFDSKTTTTSDDLELDKDIVATHRDDGNFLLLKANQDNTFEYTIRITPMMYGILFHFFTIRSYKINHKSSKELATAGMSKAPRKITESITKINNVAKDHNQKVIISHLAAYQHSLSPELDCMRQLHRPFHQIER